MPESADDKPKIVVDTVKSVDGKVEAFIPYKRKVSKKPNALRSDFYDMLNSDNDSFAPADTVQEVIEEVVSNFQSFKRKVTKNSIDQIIEEVVAFKEVEEEKDGMK